MFLTTIQPPSSPWRTFISEYSGSQVQKFTSACGNQWCSNTKLLLSCSCSSFYCPAWNYLQVFEPKYCSMYFSSHACYVPHPSVAIQKLQTLCPMELMRLPTQKFAGWPDCTTDRRILKRTMLRTHPMAWCTRTYRMHKCESVRRESDTRNSVAGFFRNIEFLALNHT